MMLSTITIRVSLLQLARMFFKILIHSASGQLCMIIRNNHTATFLFSAGWGSKKLCPAEVLVKQREHIRKKPTLECDAPLREGLCMVRLPELQTRYQYRRTSRQNGDTHNRTFGNNWWCILDDEMDLGACLHDRQGYGANTASTIEDDASSRQTGPVEP